MVKLKNNAGMTLVEVMLASGVMATALSLLFGSLMSISVIGRISEERVSARAELGSVMEGLNGKTGAQLLAYVKPTLKGPGTNRAIVVQAYQANGTAVNLPFVGQTPPTLPNPVEVKVTYTWTDEKGRINLIRASRMVGS
jgi:type II secretory pathway pseudopilin PulG